MSIRTLRFHSYGEPGAVLQLDRIDAPAPGPGQIRVAVHACGLNPADWALCRGLFPGTLPRGVGLDVSGIVDAIGDGVTDVAIGDAVFGAADYAGAEIAGAGDAGMLRHWARVPAGLDLLQAAALPMAIETAFRSIDSLRVAAGQTLLVHGAGTMMGYVAVQIAIARGARVVATAGATFADDLRGFGATVTPYGDGMVERVRGLAGGDIDLVLDASPPAGVLPQLVAIAGDARRVLTITDMATGPTLGVRTSFTEGMTLRYEVLGEFAQRAASGKLRVPIAQTFALADWRAAMAASLGGHAHGKLMLVP